MWRSWSVPTLSGPARGEAQKWTSMADTVLYIGVIFGKDFDLS